MLDPNVMGGKPCIKGVRVTVGTIIGLLASMGKFDAPDVLLMEMACDNDDIVFTRQRENNSVVYALAFS